MQVTPVTPELLVAEITELVAARSGWVRLAIDGPPPTNPRALADAVLMMQTHVEPDRRIESAMLVHAKPG